ncbi:hypothetical protein AB6A40_003053 [Gnathostoma spinigerum]|uniref:START domain-containing protein 10 n=1 Tax=Gnathostoma spinigerum TaxID=75299 RepID=A0ABD6EDX4_9BILA
MQINVVKILEDADFDYVRALCENDSGWRNVYDKKLIKVWTKNVNGSEFDMIKARTEWRDVDAAVLYDVLHDSSYRHTWDKYMVRDDDIGILNPNNDICYYSVGTLPPFRSRDFVLQRSWLDLGDEKFICNHSVCHDKYPPMEGFVRGTVYLTAYYIKALDEGCRVTYITHSDPKGKLPAWMVNRLTKVIAPKVINKLHKVSLKYTAWKARNNPNWKPWLYPEQRMLQKKINLDECKARIYKEDIIDESTLEMDGVLADSSDENGP